MASWHRFFLDFGRFWEASWEGNRSQDRPKKASKNDAKKKSNEIAKKVAIRISNPSPKEERKGMTPVQRAKPPQPRGLVGFFMIFLYDQYFLYKPSFPSS